MLSDHEQLMRCLVQPSVTVSVNLQFFDDLCDLRHLLVRHQVPVLKHPEQLFVVPHISVHLASDLY
jgi:hypothetical protein